MAKKSVAKRAASAKRPSPAKPQGTTSANKALPVSGVVAARAAAVTDNRWATLKRVDEAFDKDAREEVINISVMESGPPDPKELADEGNEHAQHYTYQQVGPGVIIGMRRGGAFESVDGFGWRDAADKAAHGNPVGAGSTRLADVGAS